jgi:2-iminobutanoate/2-iminopropanoate deaminase
MIIANKKTVHTELAPKAIGPYSQAVVAEKGMLVFASGQIPLDPQTGQVVEGGIEAQTRRVFENLEAVLKAAGSGFDRAVKTTVFLKDMDDFAGMNAVYESFFPCVPPARSTVQVARLPRDVLVEIECMALAD